MKNKIIVVFLFSLLIPNLAFASWYNPFSWFKKQPVQPPVVQVSVPTPTPVVNKQIKKEKIAPKKEKKDIKPTPKQATPATVAPLIISNGGRASPGVMVGPCSTVGPCTVPLTPIPAPEIITPPVVSPSVVAIDTFLANPTVENFNTFCTIAKTLPGIEEKKVLNDTRTDYITRKSTLYEEVGIFCTFALSEYKTKSGQLITISWLIYNPLDLLSLDNPNESDKVREVKINYNIYWKSLSKYKLIGFEYVPGNEIITPKQKIENIGTGSISFLYRNIGNLFIVPEQILSVIRANLVGN